MDDIFGAFGAEFFVVEKGHAEGADHGILVLGGAFDGGWVVDVALDGDEAVVVLGELCGVAGEGGDGVALVEGLVDEMQADASC